MKTYSNRSNTIRAAVSQGYSKDGIEVQQDGNGRWYFTPAADAVDAELMDIYGYVDCPHCGIHLTNGVLDYENIKDTVGKETADAMTREFECMACGGEFGPELDHSESAPEEDTGKRRPYNRTGTYSDAPSDVETPVAYVWFKMDELAAQGELPAKKDLIALFREQGVNRNTAATQIQRWKSARKG